MSNNFPNRAAATAVVDTFISNIRTNVKIDADKFGDGNNYVIGYLSGFLKAVAEENPEVMSRLSDHADLIKLQIESKQRAQIAAAEDAVDARFASQMVVNMNVVMKGRVKNRDHIMPYIGSLMKELKIHRFKRDLNVKFVRRLDDGCVGECFYDDEDIHIKIATNGTTFLQQMITLAHEMVHARQYLRKELGYNNTGGWAWKQRNAENYQYMNQPWEKEAYRLEKDMFAKCFPFEKPLK